MNSLDIFWKSDMSRKLKVKIFRTAVESILLYGCETWTLKVAQNNTLDGIYTKLLRRVLNIDLGNPITISYTKISLKSHIQYVEGD